ncbi:MAG: hypothetical protein ACQES2_07580 [Pseudomonadota bacterium]
MKYARGKSAVVIAVAALLLSGCSTVRNFYLDRPGEVARQPDHMMPHKDQLNLKGPVKFVTYLVNRRDFTGQEVTDELTLSFNQKGYITEIRGEERLLKKYGQVRHWNLPPNTRIRYQDDDVLDKISDGGENPRYSFVGEPHHYGKNSNNLKGFYIDHVRDGGTSAEKKYRTLEYMVYAGPRYMALKRNNQEPDQTEARIFEFDREDRLVKVYSYEGNYPVDLDPYEAMSNPLDNRFIIEKEYDYDFKGRLVRVADAKNLGRYKTEWRYNYILNTDFPGMVASFNDEGQPLNSTNYSNYSKDQHENWVERTAAVKNGTETTEKRVITYFETE